MSDSFDVSKDIRVNVYLFFVVFINICRFACSCVRVSFRFLYSCVEKSITCGDFVRTSFYRIDNRMELSKFELGREGYLQSFQRSFQIRYTPVRKCVYSRVI